MSDRGQRFTTVLVLAIQLSLGLLWFSGVFRSFRSGVGYGFLAIAIPPYGPFRGVMAIWEKPEWKERWDEKTETLGWVLQGSLSGDSPNDGIGACPVSC